MFSIIAFAVFHNSNREREGVLLFHFSRAPPLFKITIRNGK
jgi:hypothetical protein